ncbi:unnamed protein product [Pleuronectes platessa]|uniref:Uncharacterized protein n=1 Tax=Pleuronectes platessa TaxID=8262 RepID=A0A9N7VIB2_PLEPL|nr:unnamed protein product [Pleuronectes platessa]
MSPLNREASFLLWTKTRSISGPEKDSVKRSRAPVDSSRKQGETVRESSVNKVYVWSSFIHWFCGVSFNSSKFPLEPSQEPGCPWVVLRPSELRSPSVGEEPPRRRVGVQQQESMPPPQLWRFPISPHPALQRSSRSHHWFRSPLASYNNNNTTRPRCRGCDDTTAAL